MNVPTGEFRALTARVEELAARVEQVAEQAAKVRAFTAIRLEAFGYAEEPWPAVKAPRHLRSVDGGQP